MEGDEAAYWMIWDNEDNGFPPPVKVQGIKATAEKVEEDDADERETKIALKQMSKKRCLTSCFQIWRRLWQQRCCVPWSKIQLNQPLRCVSPWDKGLWKLLSMILLDKWVPMPGSQHELATSKQNWSADLDWPRDSGFCILARNLVNEFERGYPSRGFIRVIDCLDRRYGRFYNTPF